MDAKNWTVTSSDGMFTPYCPIAMKALFEFDKTMVGTAGYLGLTYFWAHTYRFYLRDASPYRRRLAHKHLCINGLDPAGESEKHLAIIQQFSG